MGIELIRSLSHIVDIRDSYTMAHQDRVTILSYLIAKKMGIDSEKLRGIVLRAMLHDIGKSMISEPTLNQAGQLSEQQAREMEQHVLLGFDLIKDIHFKWPTHEILLQHHERLDGSGYPAGLTGEGICIEARIISIADTYDFLTAYRCYSAPVSKLDAIDMIIEMANGKKFDENIVQHFFALSKTNDFNIEHTELDKSFYNYT